MAVLGADGPITIGDGEIRVDGDGTVWADRTRAGRLSVVTFADPAGSAATTAAGFGLMVRRPHRSTTRSFAGGNLEQSNVSVAERLAELTTVSRGFEALQRSISLLLNDVDGRAIDQLGRRG
jgi:flagellar basal body rod protein FlgG